MHVRIKSALAALAVLMLAVGTGVASAGAASASDNANRATLYADNYQCGGGSAPNAVLSQPVGFVNFHLAGNQLTVIIHLKGAQPDTTYYGFIQENGCSYVTGLPPLTTNSNGVSNDSATITVTPGTSYIVTLFFDPFVYDTSGVQTEEITP